MQVALAGGVTLLIGVAIVEGPPVWFFVVFTLLLLMFTTGFAPITTLAAEKLLGSMESDRTLPVPVRTVASARLVAAAVRTSPMLLGVVALAIALAKTTDIALGSLVTMATVALLLYWSALWIVYACSARFKARWFMWVPLAVVLLSAFVTDDMERALEQRWLEVQGTLSAAEPSLLVLALVVSMALLVAAIAFVASTALLTDGLVRYRFDPLEATGALGKVPKREMMAVGRGVLVAVVRLRLRLATDKFRSELMIIGALGVTIFLDLGGISQFGRTYVPIFASIMPLMIGTQLMIGRAHGSIELLQQLPHPRRLIALGHIITVMIIALPAAVIHTAARAADGVAPSVETVAFRWITFGAIGSLVAALCVWATLRRMLLLIGVAIAAIIAGTLGIGVLSAWLGLSAEQLVAMRRPFAAVLAMVVIGVSNELLARGIATFAGRAAVK